MKVLEKKFVSIKGEADRYQKEINPYIFSQNKLQYEVESKKKAKGEMRMFSLMADGADLECNYYEYSRSIYNISFSGKLVIRPYKSLYEATLDGVYGCFDVGLLAEGISESDGYLFAVKVPGKEDKAFAYVLYDSDGEIIKARQAFNLDIVNEGIIKYLKLFARDVFLPMMAEKKAEVHTA